MNDIEQLRADIRALQSERSSLGAFEMNVSETDEAIVAAVEMWRSEGDDLLRRRAFEVGIGTRRASQLLDVPMLYEQPVIAPILTAILGTKAMTKALAAFASAVPDGPDTANKQARVVEIEAELDRLEHAEEDAIEASELTGSPIARRADARPEIVLRMRG